MSYRAGEKEGEEPVILTDILGLEDALGTMDFKVARGRGVGRTIRVAVVLLASRTHAQHSAFTLLSSVVVVGLNLSPEPLLF